LSEFHLQRMCDRRDDHSMSLAVAYEGMLKLGWSTAARQAVQASTVDVRENAGAA